jgi:N-methylhydantoinase B/oxoprolinase/acetone carboxylase alpha subunit
MVWRSQDDRKITRTNTVRHRVVYVPAAMRRQIIPNQNLMKVSAGDIVCLNIPADVVTEITNILVVVPVARTQRIQR